MVLPSLVDEYGFKSSKYHDDLKNKNQPKNEPKNEPSTFGKFINKIKGKLFTESNISLSKFIFDEEF